MACECLCISTDVGDAKRILNNDWFIVNPADHVELAEKICKAINCSDNSKQAVKLQNRNKVIQNFSIENVVKEYEKMFY